MYQIGLVGLITVTAGDDTRVDTRCVAVPKVDVDIGNRFASGVVDKLNIDVGIYAFLIFGDVRANVFSVNVVRALSSLRDKRARPASVEGVGIGGKTCRIRLMVCVQDIIQVEALVDAAYRRERAVSLVDLTGD